MILKTPRTVKESESNSTEVSSQTQRKDIANSN